MDSVESGKAAAEEALKRYGNIPIHALTAETFQDELRDAFPLLNDELDPSFLLELLYFFPFEKIYISAGSYDQYLYDLEKTVIDNYDAGNFQVSFFYAHLVFMSYVYYCVERAFQAEPDRMKDVFYPINSYRGKDDKPDLDNYKSVYEFSKIPEKEIFKIFRIMGMDHDQIRSLSKYVSDRDDYAHATGQGNISEEALIQNVHTIKRHMETLNHLFEPIVKQLYIDYLLEFAEYDYSSIVDSAFDFILDNYLSIHEVASLCNMGISGIRNENAAFKEKYRFIKKAHCAFIEYCMENYGITRPATYDSLRDEDYLYYKYEGKASEYVENELGISAYRCAKDGGEFPIYECPDCGEEQLVYDADKEQFHCFSCGVTYTSEDICFCERCGTIMHKTGDAPVCKSCYEALTAE